MKMTAIATAKTQTSPDKPLTGLDALYASRRGLAVSIISKNTALTRLRAEASREASLLEEMANLASAETTEMRNWADGGCQGDAPAGKTAERQVIAGKIAAAKATGSAAHGAIQDIDYELRQLHADHAKADQAIHIAALDAMQHESMAIREQYAAAVDVVRALAAKLLGLTSYLGAEGRRLIDHHADADAGKVYLLRVEALSRLPMSDPGVTQGEIIAAANGWSKRAAALRKGSQS
jgi:hypothetical protein